MPSSTSVVMAPILARQFAKLQAPPFQSSPTTGVPPSLLQKPVVSPLRWAQWDQALQHHPSTTFVQYLLKGIKEGFHIGLHSTPPSHPPARNTPSAQENQAVIDAYLQGQVEKGYMAGPFPPEESTAIRTSSMAVIPKKTPGKWRVIVDLSRPKDRSINDHLRRGATHVAYSSVADAAHVMHFLGRDTCMAKVDIKEAYRIVPIHPDDRHFLGITWRGRVYVDCQLPFGLASAPAIFSALGEALEWILRRRGVRAVIHYIDDFLLLGSPATSECTQALAITLQTCQELGIPVAQEKTEGPTIRLTFLGIQLDSSAMCTSLPADRMQNLSQMVQSLQHAKTVRDTHQFESLIGHLVHAATVCPLGKAFLNNLFAVKATMRPGQIRQLNLAAREELAWWDIFLSEWSGISVHQFLILRQPQHHLYCDASGAWGCAAWTNHDWFQCPWGTWALRHSTAVQELFPVALAAGLWGRSWSGTGVMCHSDNAAVVSQINSLHARDPMASHLLQCLALFQALYDFRLTASHVPRQYNSEANRLSRGKAPLSQVTHPCPPPPSAQIPPALLLLLQSEPPVATLHIWRGLFKSFWKSVFPPPQERSTQQHGASTNPS